jgi:predicted phage terminase large subunit-like protein
MKKGEKLVAKPYLCRTCGKTKPKKQFGLRAQTKNEQKVLGLAPTTKVSRSVCLVCEAADEKEELEAAVADNVRIKTMRHARRTLAKAEAKKEKKAEKREKQIHGVKEELLERQLARKSLLQFLKRFYPRYIAGWVHVDICNRLERFMEDVVAGKNPRLMLFMPPRHGKSIIASQHFPAWVLGQHPEFEIIAASYGSSLPIKFSRYVRALLRDPKYQKIFPDTVLDKENENVEGWGTTDGGGYIPAGVGGGITGKGAHILIIDDPVKDAEEADSETTRESVWDWYGSTAYTRLAPLSGVLVIQTRWHDDDLSGRLIQQMRDAYKELENLDREVTEQLNRELDDGEIDNVKYTMCIADLAKDIRQKRSEIDSWEIVSYPAEAEYDEYQDDRGNILFVDPESGMPVQDVIDFDKSAARLLRHKGDALHPARYPSDRLKKIKNALQSRHWHALYQQNPVPEEGQYFKKEMFRYRKGMLDVRNLPIAMAWDLAIGKKQTNDWTVGIVGAIDYEGNIQIIDQLRGRWDTNEIARNIIMTYSKYRSMTDQMCLVGIERGQLELAIRPELNRLSNELRIFPAYDNELKPLTDKLIRARPLQGFMQGGKLVLADVELNPWVEILVHELLRFPNGTFDDCVDALAWLARMVERNFSKPRRLDPERRRRKKEGEMTVAERMKEAYRKQGGGRDPMAA